MGARIVPAITIKATNPNAKPASSIADNMVITFFIVYFLSSSTKSRLN